MKIALNCDWGAFEVSDEVLREMGLGTGSGYLYPENLGLPEDAPLLAVRSHPRLIRAIEAVGVERAHSDHAQGDRIRVVEIPDGCKTVYITDYDGREGVTWSESEVHHA